MQLNDRVKTQLVLLKFSKSLSFPIIRTVLSSPAQQIHNIGMNSQLQKYGDRFPREVISYAVRIYHRCSQGLPHETEEIVR